MHRKILIITGSRGEYGYIRPIIDLIKNDLDLSYETIVTNMHLLSDFGLSEEEFINDGIDITYRIYNTLSEYNIITMPKSLGIFLLQIPEIIYKSNPDIVLIAGDRGEMLMGAIASAHMNIPVAHIQAGEISGNIDGNIRHAITKISHIHFASTQDAYNRVLNFGEEKFRVFKTGAPLVDDIMNEDFINNSVLDDYRIDKNKKLILCVQHSVTENYERSYEDAVCVFKSINKLNAEVVAILPNSDAGSNMVKKAMIDYSEKYHVFKTLPRDHYLGFMKYADLMIGNSSSGIMESPSFKLPTINVGRRQIGRQQAINIINVENSSYSIDDAIQKALSSEFVGMLKKCINPYGDGMASKRIIDVFNRIVIDDRLINKKNTY